MREEKTSENTVASTLQETCKPLLSRYNDGQRRIIYDYWEMLRFTRKTGKISQSIIQTEMAYWQRFDTDVVAAALAVHLEKYPTLRETYTRGILRNMQSEKAAGGKPSPAGRKRQPPKENFKSGERNLNSLIE